MQPEAGEHHAKPGPQLRFDLPRRSHHRIFTAAHAQAHQAVQHDAPHVWACSGSLWQHGSPTGKRRGGRKCKTAPCQLASGLTGPASAGDGVAGRFWGGNHSGMVADIICSACSTLWLICRPCSTAWCGGSHAEPATASQAAWQAAAYAPPLGRDLNRCCQVSMQWLYTIMCHSSASSLVAARASWGCQQLPG